MFDFDLDLWGQGHTKCCPVPSIHVTYPATTFEASMSNPLGGDTFTSKYII